MHTAGKLTLFCNQAFPQLWCPNFTNQETRLPWVDLFLAVLVDSGAPGRQPVGGGQQALHLSQGRLLKHHPPVTSHHIFISKILNFPFFLHVFFPVQPPGWNGPDDDEIFSYRSKTGTILQPAQKNKSNLLMSTQFHSCYNLYTNIQCLSAY